ncbi:MAG TPA: GTP-binding protein, partial [Alphaproteobacteria bacterium]|nr:GTP-binding protein [Alphaproteobacteria bacterium]
LQQLRRGNRRPFSRVVVDAHRLRHPEAVVERLDPRAPAIGLRDHTVARSFHLAEVI